VNTDSFMIAMKDELKPRLLTYGMQLDDIGLGEFNDTVLIGVEKPMLLIFGNIRCGDTVKDKQFQVALKPEQVESGNRELVREIAADVTKSMRAALGR
jgi:hypothetical protein